MKKTVYLGVITLIAIVCVLYGVKEWYDGKVMNFSFGNDEKQYSAVENTTLEAFDSIAVDAAVMDLTIVEGTDYSLDYKGTENLEMTYQIEKGELTVKQRKKGKLIGNNGAELIVTVPKDVQLEKTIITVDVGDVDVDSVDMKTLEADSDVGDIMVENTSVDNVVLDSDTGDIDVDNCSFVTLDISSDVGDMEVDSSMDISDYVFDLKTDVGEVEVGAEAYGKKYFHAGKNGCITARGNVGDISIWFSIVLILYASFINTNLMDELLNYEISLLN